MPTSAPRAASPKLSARMKENRSRRRKPSALRMASSRKRSRMAMLMVLTVTSIRVNTTTPLMDRVSTLTFPSMLMNPI